MGTFTKALTNLLCFGNFVGSDCTAYEEKYEKMFANMFIVLKAAEIVNRPEGFNCNIGMSRNN